MNKLKNAFISFKDKLIGIIRFIRTEKYRRSANIILRFSMCLLSLGIMIMATFTYAWMARNRDVSADSMQVDTKELDDIVVSITVHDCIGTDENGAYYFSKETASVNNLKKYMLLSKSDRQLLLHVHFEDPATLTGISMIATTETEYFMGDGSHPLLGSADGRGEEYDNVLSSIIAFYIVNAEDATYNSNDAYKVASLGTPNSFINTSDFSMINNLTLLDNQTVSDIYLVLDYNSDLVTKVLFENLGNNSFETSDGSFLDAVVYIWDIELKLIKN